MKLDAARAIEAIPLIRMANFDFDKNIPQVLADTVTKSQTPRE